MAITISISMSGDIHRSGDYSLASGMLLLRVACGTLFLLEDAFHITGSKRRGSSGDKRATASSRLGRPVKFPLELNAETFALLGRHDVMLEDFGESPPSPPTHDCDGFPIVHIIRMVSAVAASPDSACAHRNDGLSPYPLYINS
uniref:Uncharacterized protein n=1 Tax=Chromera velia CCMP2878 TaxID=1169474 RepID=A0A0G4FUS1_9ALVE|eukprot:Cvel_3773.t1-p1 / transcript=Cvel_3773.t1 / gene=Cvel_3773 / organism=Chromera_velia_CCMP2878 / gene_product=hypothetical protein / transcript_product=hypothetical protein / location=Cvel_scaffold158:33295-36296(+) / protein_length=143 / sequence_SO=supercontig / SO=protein_coding / is_pseudo=false